jgi:hypothetical protein
MPSRGGVIRKSLSVVKQILGDIIPVPAIGNPLPHEKIVKKIRYDE